MSIPGPKQRFEDVCYSAARRPENGARQIVHTRSEIPRAQPLTLVVTRSMLLAPTCSSIAAQPHKAISPIQGKPELQTTAKLCVLVAN
jgi:hypothetical protein